MDTDVYLESILVNNYNQYGYKGKNIIRDIFFKVLIFLLLLAIVFKVFSLGLITLLNILIVSSMFKILACVISMYILSIYQ